MANTKSLPKRKHFAIETKQIARENLKNSNAAISNGIGKVFDTVDHGSTYIRNGQVLAALPAHGGDLANGDDIAGSAFNNLVHVGGDPSGALTMVGYGFAGFIGAAYAIGFGRAIYQTHRRLHVNSYSYIERRMRHVDKRTSTYQPKSHYDIFINYGQQLLDRNAIASGNMYEITQDPKRYKKKYIEFNKNNTADSIDADFTSLYEIAAPNRKDSTKTTKLTKFINKVSNSKPAIVASYIWNWASNNAYAFWIVWMPFALAAGAAATFTLPFLPIIVGITLGLGGIFTAWKIAEMAWAAKKANDRLRKINNALAGKGNAELINLVGRLDGKQIKVAHIQHLDPRLKAAFKANPNMVVDINSLSDPQYKPGLRARVIAKIMKDLGATEAKRKAHIQAELKQRVYIKYEHTALMNKFVPGYGWNEDPTKKTKAHIEFNKMYKNNVAAYALKISDDAAVNDILEKRNFADAVVKSEAKLKNYVRGSQAERHGHLGVSIALSAIGGFIGPLFILWLASSVVAVPVLLGVAALAATAAFLGGSMLYTVGGALVGTLFGIQTAAQRRQAQLDFDHRVNTKLSESYKNERITKATKLCQLEVSVEKKIALLNQDPGKVRSLKRAGFDINKIDFYNDYRYSKQKTNPSAWTWFKKGLNRVYQALGGGQTGVLISRSLFLVGCVFAPALAVLPFGGPIAFVGVALIMAITVGTLRVMQYQQERNQQKREFFVETIDARISDAIKKDKELTAILALENQPSQPTAAPKPQAPAIELKAMPKKKKVKRSHVNDDASVPLLGNDTITIRKKMVERTSSFDQGFFETDRASVKLDASANSVADTSVKLEDSSSSEDSSLKVKKA